MAAQCGAKTRADGRCRKSPMPNGRCRLHGGLSTGPKDQTGNTNRLTHGMYASYFTAAELAASAETKLGSVEIEIRVCRMRLARALKAEAKSRNKPELAEIIKRDVAANVGAKKERRWHRIDYGKAIDIILGRIESLEKTRLLLRIELGLSDDDLDTDALTTAAPDEKAPEAPIS